MTQRKPTDLFGEISDTRFIIYLISKGELTDENFKCKSNEFLELIRLAVEKKIPLIQIREKKLSARHLFELTEKTIKISNQTATKILVNDRADIAFAAKADGVHLPSHSIPASFIRENFPEQFIIGKSCHSLEDCLEAKKQKADFAVLSPIFPTPNKGTPLGLAKLKKTCELLKPFPVIALGGIDKTNCEEVLKIADGFAAIRFLSDFLTRRRKDAKTQDLFQTALK